MPTILKTKNSVTTTVVPTTLQQGELAVNITDKKVWVGNAATTPVQLLGGGADGTFTNISVSGVATFGAGTVSLPSITTTGDTNTGIFFPAADTIAFTEGGAESMRIDSSGNVFIGGAAFANYKLGVYGDIRVVNAGYTMGGTYTPQSGDMGIGRESNGGMIFVNSSERMRIDSSGNVGIGVTSPTAQLATLGNVNIGNNSSTNPFSYLRFGCSQYGASDIRPVDYGGHTSGLAFYTDGTADTTINPTERMRIDSSGNLLVGTTTAINKVTIKAGNQNQLSLDNAGEQYTGINFYNNGNAKSYVYHDQTNIRFYVVNASNGVYLAANATAWTAVSDERAKENLIPITDALNKVSSLRAVTGNYIADKDKKSKSFLIAQDVLKVLPEAVDATDPDKLGIAYTDLIPLLVASIKELKAEIDQLKGK